MLCSNVSFPLSEVHVIQTCFCPLENANPHGKVRGANVGPTWVLAAPGRPHVGPINFDIEGCVHVKAPGWHTDRCLVHPPTYSVMENSAKMSHSLSTDGALNWVTETNVQKGPDIHQIDRSFYRLVCLTHLWSIDTLNGLCKEFSCM